MGHETETEVRGNDLSQDGSISGRSETTEQCLRRGVEAFVRVSVLIGIEAVRQWLASANPDLRNGRVALPLPGERQRIIREYHSRFGLRVVGGRQEENCGQPQEVSDETEKRN